MILSTPVLVGYVFLIRLSDRQFASIQWVRKESSILCISFFHCQEENPSPGLKQFCLCVCALSCIHLFVTPMDCSLPESSVYELFQERIMEGDAIYLLQGIFQAQGSNPHVLCWQASSLPLHQLGSLDSAFSCI